MNVLNCLGVGQVANTKQTNADEIFIYLPGKFPTAEGGVNLDAVKVDKQAMDSNGKQVNTKMLKTNKMVPARWKNIGEPNRLTPPDVREGTQVAVYQFMGSNDYWWTTWGFGANTMRLETIIYGWNGMPAINEESDFDISKYYTMTISTRDGQMVLRNSNVNGEKSIIETTFNFMEGHFVMAGAQKNMLVYDDVNHSLTFTNAEKSVLTVAKDKIYGFAKGGIMLQTDAAIQTKSDQLLIEANSVLINVKNQTEINSPTTQHNGNLNVDGAITSTGNMTSQAVVQGMSGVKSGKQDLDGHKHGGVESGSSQTSPPV